MAKDYTKKDEKKAMDMIKKDIIKSFTKIYGFAPSAKSIVPLESAQSGVTYTFLAFAIKGIGYTYTIGLEVEKNPVYDL